MLLREMSLVRVAPLRGASCTTGFSAARGVPVLDDFFSFAGNSDPPGGGGTSGMADSCGGSKPGADSSLRGAEIPPGDASAAVGACGGAAVPPELGGGGGVAISAVAGATSGDVAIPPTIAALWCPAGTATAGAAGTCWKLAGTVGLPVIGPPARRAGTINVVTRISGAVCGGTTASA